MGSSCVRWPAGRTVAVVVVARLAAKMAKRVLANIFVSERRVGGDLLVVVGFFFGCFSVFGSGTMRIEEKESGGPSFTLRFTSSLYPKLSLLKLVLLMHESALVIYSPSADIFPII